MTKNSLTLAIGLFLSLFNYFGLCSSVARGYALEGTATFHPPVDFTPPGTSHDFGKHAVTRLVDWDADRDLDLLIGGGDGHVWLIQNQGQMKFAAPEAILILNQPLRLGKEATTACMIDLNGDHKPDLVVAHSNTQVQVMFNRGSQDKPVFDSPQSLSNGEGKTLQLPAGCGGRIDMGDWDHDGDADLIAGHFSGSIMCFANVGTAQSAQFGDGVALKVGRAEPSFSYNVHPTLFDINQDGKCDVAYGMNWGTIGFLVSDNSAMKQPVLSPSIATELAPLLATGRSIDLRALAGDDATPTFGDLDGDGTLDMVSGGRQGKIFLLRGVPVSDQLHRLDAIMREHREHLGEDLRSQEPLRNELIGLHQGLYRLCQGFFRTSSTRSNIRKFYIRHITENAKWLKHGQHDEATEPYIPSLAQQVWTLLMLLHDGDPADQTHRRFVAETIGFEGRLKDILVEFGTLIIENGRATPNQQETLYSYLSQIPPQLLWDRSVNAMTEVITIGEYLGPRLEVLHAGGVNIFASESGKPGSSENPFPKDFARAENDYFGVVLAHELNHRVDATRFVAVPKYNVKYWRHMQKICGPDVKFNASSGVGVDWKATKQHFLMNKQWDGNDKHWNTAWADYWLTGAGKSRTFNVCRNETTYTPPRFGIPFFLETRQESIASLANQYFTDSEHMFMFALDRYHRGSPGCLDEWLLMADVYSLDRDFTYLYRHANGSVSLQRTVAKLTRDQLGHINSIVLRGQTYNFVLDANGLVEKVVEEDKP